MYERIMEVGFESSHQFQFLLYHEGLLKDMAGEVRVRVKYSPPNQTIVMGVTCE